MSESFSSLPPEEEAQFRVFEEHQKANAKRAMVIGLTTAIGIGVLLLIIAAAFWGTALKPNQDTGPTPAATPTPAAATPTPAAAPAATPTPAAAPAATDPAAAPAAATPAAPAAPATATPAAPATPAAN
jgi:hypothetical protein